MRIKKIIASNMQEGREIIERELGNDALILSHRNTKLANGTPAIEIVAAIDNKNIIVGDSHGFSQTSVFHQMFILAVDGHEELRLEQRMHELYFFFSGVA